MFDHISSSLIQRAMQPSVTYGSHILMETLRQMQKASGHGVCTILTQAEPWTIAREQFAAFNDVHMRYLHSMEHDELEEMENTLPPTSIVMGLGGGQAMDAAKYVAWKRNIPLLLAPTIISVDAAVTNTIAVREGKRVRYIGFVVADAVAVDFALITQAPAALNRAGIGDLLSIHTALWDWQYASEAARSDYDPTVAAQTRAILDGVDTRAEAIARCDEDALRFIMDSFVQENTLCLHVGSSRPEEGSEHFLGYTIEYVTGQSYVHGQLICLCTYLMAHVQQNRPEWVRQVIERTRCPWRPAELGIRRDALIQALLTAGDYAKAEAFPASVLTQRPITRQYAEQLVRECEA